MKKDEFVQKINEAGLGGKVFVTPTNYAGGPHFLGCFFNGKQWVVYENDERGKHDDLLRTTSEEGAFQYLFDYMIGKFISLKSNDMEMELINSFADFVNTQGVSVGYRFKQLDTPEEYFNQPSLCGIFYIEQDKWLFVHQAFPAPGDNPAVWLHHTTYTSLRELLKSETERISRKIRIAQKRQDNSDKAQ